MRFKNDGNWPVSHRCEHTEQKRQGRHDDISAESWLWFGCLFLLIVIAPAIVEFLV